MLDFYVNTRIRFSVIRDNQSGDNGVDCIMINIFSPIGHQTVVLSGLKRSWSSNPSKLKKSVLPYRGYFIKLHSREIKTLHQKFGI